MAWHQCPIEGCTRMVPYEKLCCWAHWRLVDRKLQAAVYREWERGVSDAYLAARQAAIDDANQKVAAAEKAPRPVFGQDLPAPASGCQVVGNSIVCRRRRR